MTRDRYPFAQAMQSALVVDGALGARDPRRAICENIERPADVVVPLSQMPSSFEARSIWNQVRSLREETTSALIQGCGAAGSAVALAYLMRHVEPHGDPAAAAGLFVYGATMVVAFLVSSLYHAVRRPRLRAILQRIDHCTIFLLIAGTCTPFALLPLRHHGGLALLGAVWTLALGGIAVRLFNPRLYRRIAIPLYLVTGWLGVLWSAPLYHALGDGLLPLMLAGIVSYTGGLVPYCSHRPFSNCLWHLSVVGGTAWFFTAVNQLLP